MNSQIGQVSRESQFEILERLKDMVWQYGEILTFFDVTERIAVFGVPIMGTDGFRNDKEIVVSRRGVVIRYDVVHHRVIVTIEGAARFEYYFWNAKATWFPLSEYDVVVVAFDYVSDWIEIP